MISLMLEKNPISRWAPDKLLAHPWMKVGTVDGSTARKKFPPRLSDITKGLRNSFKELIVAHHNSEIATLTKPKTPAGKEEKTHADEKKASPDEKAPHDDKAKTAPKPLKLSYGDPTV
eukprot:TRINITY_DN10630_c0_g1_i3.p1 TRINITY_DN10630_c0_g1~~TRINITY_DN10630_c0_g1_i3.p1  ORF type:complete len:118 (-),score=5.90 TRINITY_DN10630_c0_g1_i3:33-386(-)